MDLNSNSNWELDTRLTSHASSNVVVLEGEVEKAKGSGGIRRTMRSLRRYMNPEPIKDIENNGLTGREKMCTTTMNHAPPGGG